MGWAGLPWDEVVVVVVVVAIFGTIIPDFHRVQMLGVGDCSRYGDRGLGEGSANQNTQAYGHNIYERWRRENDCSLMCYTCSQVGVCFIRYFRNQEELKMYLTLTDTCVVHWIIDFLHLIIYNRKYIQINVNNHWLCCHPPDTLLLIQIHDILFAQ